MHSFDYDLLVIGAGSGGVRAARMAAANGYKVAVVEEKALGGTCVNVGCVPKKLLVYASHFSDEFESATGFGWSAADHDFDWSTLIERKNAEITRLNGIYGRMLDAAGVDIMKGRAVFIDSHSVRVGEKNFSAEKILIAVGGTPFIPDFPGAEYVISSDQAFYLEKLPNTVAVVGGGYIAVEFAGIFNGLGTDTHLVYRGEQLLKAFDQDVAHFASDEIAKKGINIHLQCQIDRIEKIDNGQLLCHYHDGQTLQVDEVMYATGRRALSDNLGLENTAVTCQANGTINADHYDFSTADDAIFALGDVIGTPELTPVALAQAMVFLDRYFPNKQCDQKKVPRTMSYEAIPTAVFCQPNMASVGKTEAQLKQQGLHLDVYISEFKHLKNTLSGSDERVYMKLIVDQASQVLLAMHMVGPDAGEIIQGFAVAVNAGLTKTQLDNTIGIHPTAAEEFVTLREIKYSC